QIGHDLDHPRRIRMHDDGSVGEREVEADVFCLDRLGARLDCLSYGISKIDGGFFQFDLTGDDSIDLEEVVEEPRLVTHLARNDVPRFLEAWLEIRVF